MARAELTGTRIRERRAQLGLKQAELARDVQVSPAYLNLIEHNRRRVSDALLARLAQALGTRPEVLAEGAESTLFDALREAAATEPRASLPIPERAELERIEEFAGRYPGWAALLADRQVRVAQLERQLEVLSERLAQDPHLSASLHEVLSAVSAIRATAAILAETEDIEPLWRERFHGNLHDDSERLSHAAEAMVSWLDTGSGGEMGLSSPQEEFDDWLAQQGHHLAPLERPDPPAPATLTENAPELRSAAARSLARDWIARAAREARAMPAPAFARAMTETGREPARLAQIFGQSPLAVFRRMAALPAEVTGGPVGLVLCDGAGALTFRKPLEGFTLPRFAAACPLWPLYRALVRPGMAIRSTVEMAGRVPRRFLTYAWCEARQPQGFGGPEVIEAGMLILPAPGSAPSPGSGARAGAAAAWAMTGWGRLGLPADFPAAPAPPPDPAPAGPPVGIGSTCRVCPRAGCAARREPSIVSA